MPRVASIGCPNQHLDLRSTPLSSSITKDPGRFYSDSYFAGYRGGVYERNEHWTAFFGNIAGRIVDEIAPSTTLDAGCAKGFLVEQLLARGVDAEGVDISEDAVDDAPPEVRLHLRLGSLLEPLGKRYDLITCIEVIEHLEPRDAEVTIANLCAHTDDILLSSTPDEYREATHVNVRPAEHWAERFAHQGFVRDVDYDATYISPWTARFRRARDPWPRTVAAYERALARLLAERHQRTELLLEQDQKLAQSDRDLQRLGERLSAAEDRLEGIPDAQTVELRRLAAELSISEAALRDAFHHFELLEAAHLNHVVGLQSEVAIYRHSTTHRLATRMQHGVRRVLPARTVAGRAVANMARVGSVLAEEGPRGLVRRIRARARTRGNRPAMPEAAGHGVSDPQRHYDEWCRRVEPDAAELSRQRNESQAWVDAPLVSVVVPIHETEDVWLDAAITSVIAQSYERWELCLVDDASTRDGVRLRLEHWAAKDPRIRTTFRPRNGGIAAATNTAIAMSRGELVAFLDHDDVVQPHALYSSVAFLMAHADHGLVYSDEDHLRPDGVRADPYLKSGFSSDLLLTNNYMCHFLVVRKSVLDDVGGLREGFDGSQDHDLLLRLTEGTATGHIDGALYSWRQVQGSTALQGDAKDYAWDAGIRAVSDALRRRGTDGWVQKGGAPGWYTVRYRITGNPLVSVVIPTRDRVDLLRACIRSIETRTDWPNWELVIVDNGSEDDETLDYLDALRHKVVRDPGYFNYSRIMNRGVRATRGEHVLMLNNDVEVIASTWMTAMLEHSQRYDIGGVGARLLFPGGEPQHEGIRIGGGIIAGNIDHHGYYNLGHSIRDVSAVTGACMMMRRDVFDQIEGFDERLRVAFNDVDLCLRIRRAGYRIVYQPLAELYHAESASRGRLHPMADERLLVSLWGGADDLSDPYVSRYIAAYDPLTLRP